MKAVVARAPGEADVLDYVDVPDPIAGPGEVVIHVRASGVCSRDVIARRGGFKATRFPGVLGHEIAGHLVHVGAGVTGFAPGDRVATIQAQPCGACAHCRTGRENICRRGAGFFGESVPGGYAEKVVARVSALIPLPDDVPFEHGCIIACAVGTALHAVRARGRVSVGETVLVTGASGGVGLHTLQLAKLSGARTIAVTTSQSKESVLRDHGADDVIVAHDLEFVDLVRAATAGRGVDAVLDIVGAATFPASVRCLAPGGRLVLVGNVTAEPVRIAPALTILKELDLVGSGPCTRQEAADAIELTRRRLVRPVVDRTLHLSEAATAHRMIERREVAGRIVLVPNGG